MEGSPSAARELISFTAQLSRRCGMFKLGDTVNYHGRAHVVVGSDPMSVTPRLIEVEDIDSGRIRRVAPDKLQPLPAGLTRPGKNRGSAAGKSKERRLQD